jgi:hypothetical protein
MTRLPKKANDPKRGQSFTDAGVADSGSSGQGIRYENDIAGIAIDAGIRELPHLVVALGRYEAAPQFKIAFAA